jgi:hypothetical protein
MPFLVVLIFWLTIIFGSFGLFAKPSATVCRPEQAPTAIAVVATC